MKYKNFGSEVWAKIRSAIEAEVTQCQKLGQRPVAAFDADGTLWDADLGEGFFQYQINNKLLTNLPENPWKHYRTQKESGEPRPAYLWLAQINAGRPLAQIQKWAEDHLRSIQPIPLFDAQKELIDLLHKNNVDVYIVTASIKWSVEPGGNLYQIENKNIIGVATKVVNGIITDIQDGEITFREGKYQALLSHTNGRKPFLCSGNSLGDISLLEGATRIALAVTSAPPGHELYEPEQKLQQEARSRGWICHQF